MTRLVCDIINIIGHCPSNDNHTQQCPLLVLISMCMYVIACLHSRVAGLRGRSSGPTAGPTAGPCRADRYVAGIRQLYFTPFNHAPGKIAGARKIGPGKIAGAGRTAGAGKITRPRKTGQVMRARKTGQVGQTQTKTRESTCAPDAIRYLARSRGSIRPIASSKALTHQGWWNRASLRAGACQEGTIPAKAGRKQHHEHPDQGHGRPDVPR